MAIQGVSADDFKRILAENFTPSASIKTPERLFGREQALETIDRSFSSPGRQVFIFGDRGVGKTSLAQTAANVHNSAQNSYIYVVCDQSTTFGKIVRSIGLAACDLESRMKLGGSARQLGFSALGFGATYKGPDPSSIDIQEPTSINEALDVMRFVKGRRPGTQVVIVDEMERITDGVEKERFAEFIKSIPELDNDLKFIFCGIGTTLDEIIGAHQSVGRVLETINLPKLHHNYLWDILDRASKQSKIEIPREILIRIGQISDGFPHYVHLIGESMFWSAFDDPDDVSVFSADHYKSGIEGAIERAEATLRQQYERATMKTRNTEDYEEALWALADNMSDRRQITEVYASSYKRIMSGRVGRDVLEREKFNQRLLAMRGEGHGSIIKGYGSGWFGFRENITRGYVRLRAERAGVELGRDVR